VLGLNDFVGKVLNHHRICLEQWIAWILLNWLWLFGILLEHFLMFVFAELLFVHEIFHHLLFLIFALIKFDDQLLTIDLLVVKALESNNC
jgi:hypothetical protein